MKIYCLEDFKVEFEKLISKKQYKSLQQEIIKYFFDKSVEQLSSGTRLNNSSVSPYIKKKIARKRWFSLLFSSDYKKLKIIPNVCSS